MFRKYNSIENSYRNKFVDYCKNLGDIEWVALEKVHGANFGFIVSGGEVTPFKRTSTIGKNPYTGEYDFYGCGSVVERYENLVKNLELAFDQPVQIYGELYGDGIQKEVKYGDKDFIVFDIYLMDDEVFVDWDTVADTCFDYSIPCVPEIARGSIETLLTISSEFNSIVASNNGHSSKAEGLVIKQLKNEAFLPNGSRAIIKNKSESFSEKKQKTPKKPNNDIPDNLKPLYKDFSQYLNSNRLNNVLSKVGGITQKDFGKIQGMLVQDAKEEFERDEYKIPKDDWKAISKVIGKSAGHVVRKDWLNILGNREI